MAEIIPGIFLGNLNAASSKTLLQKNDIHTILTISLGNQDELPPRYTNLNNYILILTQNIEQHSLQPNFDQLNLLEHLMLPIRIIRESMSEIKQSKKKGAILIHCQTGLTLSPSILVGYLIKEQGMTLKSAYKLISQKYSCFLPLNISQQLTLFQIKVRQHQIQMSKSRAIFENQKIVTRQTLLVDMKEERTLDDGENAQTQVNLQEHGDVKMIKHDDLKYSQSDVSSQQLMAFQRKEDGKVMSQSAMPSQVNFNKDQAAIEGGHSQNNGLKEEMKDKMKHTHQLSKIAANKLESIPLILGLSPIQSPPTSILSQNEEDTGGTQSNQFSQINMKQKYFGLQGSQNATSQRGQETKPHPSNFILTQNHAFDDTESQQNDRNQLTNYFDNHKALVDEQALWTALDKIEEELVHEDKRASSPLMSQNNISRDQQYLLSAKRQSSKLLQVSSPPKKTGLKLIIGNRNKSPNKIISRKDNRYSWGKLVGHIEHKQTFENKLLAESELRLNGYNPAKQDHSTGNINKSNILILKKDESSKVGENQSFVTGFAKGETNANKTMSNFNQAVLEEKKEGELARLATSGNEHESNQLMKSKLNNSQSRDSLKQGVSIEQEKSESKSGQHKLEGLLGISKDGEDQTPPKKLPKKPSKKELGTGISNVQDGDTTQTTFFNHNQQTPYEIIAPPESNFLPSGFIPTLQPFTMSQKRSRDFVIGQPKPSHNKFSVQSLFKQQFSNQIALQKIKEMSQEVSFHRKRMTLEQPPNGLDMKLITGSSFSDLPFVQKTQVPAHLSKVGGSPSHQELMTVNKESMLILENDPMRYIKGSKAQLQHQFYSVQNKNFGKRNQSLNGHTSIERLIHLKKLKEKEKASMNIHYIPSEHKQSDEFLAFSRTRFINGEEGHQDILANSPLKVDKFPQLQSASKKDAQRPSEPSAQGSPNNSGTFPLIFGTGTQVLPKLSSKKNSPKQSKQTSRKITEKRATDPVDQNITEHEQTPHYQEQLLGQPPRLLMAGSSNNSIQQEYIMMDPTQQSKEKIENNSEEIFGFMHRISNGFLSPKVLNKASYLHHVRQHQLKQQEVKERILEISQKYFPAAKLEDQKDRANVMSKINLSSEAEISVEDNNSALGMILREGSSQIRSREKEWEVMPNHEYFTRGSDLRGIDKNLISLDAEKQALFNEAKNEDKILRVIKEHAKIVKNLRVRKRSHFNTFSQVANQAPFAKKYSQSCQPAKHQVVVPPQPGMATSRDNSSMTNQINMWYQQKQTKLKKQNYQFVPNQRLSSNASNQQSQTFQPASQENLHQNIDSSRSISPTSPRFPGQQSITSGMSLVSLNDQQQQVHVNRGFRNRYKNKGEIKRQMQEKKDRQQLLKFQLKTKGAINTSQVDRIFRVSKLQTSGQLSGEFTSGEAQPTQAISPQVEETGAQLNQDILHADVSAEAESSYFDQWNLQNKDIVISSQLSHLSSSQKKDRIQALQKLSQVRTRNQPAQIGEPTYVPEQSTKEMARTQSTFNQV